MSSYQITDIEIAQSSVDLLRKHVRKHNGHVLEKIDKAVNWDSLVAPIEKTIKDADELDKSFDLKLVVKSLVLKELYGLGEFPFEHEVADRKSFQKFLNIEYGDLVPSNELLDAYHDYLKMAGKYDNMFDRFFKQMMDANLIPENDLLVDETIVETVKDNGKKSDFDVPLLAEDISEAGVQANHSVEDMIKEIEDRVRNIYEKKSPEEKKILEKTGLTFDKSQEIKVTPEQSNDIKPVKEIKPESKSKNIYEKLSSIDDKIRSLNVSAEDVNKELDEQIELFTKKDTPAEEKVTENVKEVTQNQEELYKKLFESFYNQLKDNKLVTDKFDAVMPGLEAVKETAKDKTEVKSSVEVPAVEQTVKTEKTEVPAAEEQTDADVVKPVFYSDFVEEQRTIESTGLTVPVVMRPKKREINLKEKKKYPVFNDANLTEDYEFGLRFYKLGFKTSFVNLKTERENGNTRIATGEYFPNTFWGAVKQRSRWLAGIVFQNWKIHGWGGSFKTKYFLLRDRKSILSFVGTALSYLCLIYFMVYAFTLSMGYSSPMLKPIVSTTSPLWYLMLGATFFMVIRMFHRFAFTYNWYGFRYALFGLFRMLIDNVVNLFAMMRAIKVFRQTKDKVVWDSTEHY